MSYIIDRNQKGKTVYFDGHCEYIGICDVGSYVIDKLTKKKNDEFYSKWNVTDDNGNEYEVTAKLRLVQVAPTLTTRILTTLGFLRAVTEVRHVPVIDIEVRDTYGDMISDSKSIVITNRDIFSTSLQRNLFGNAKVDAIYSGLGVGLNNPVDDRKYMDNFTMMEEAGKPFNRGGLMDLIAKLERKIVVTGKKDK